MPEEKTAHLIRKYTSVVAGELEVTHCLDGGDFFFWPEVNWFEGVEEEDQKRLAEVIQHTRNRYARRLPGGYEELRRMPERLREHARRVARKIDEAFALPAETPDAKKRKSKLHELRRLAEEVEALLDEHGEEEAVGTFFPECIEPRWVISSAVRSPSTGADSEPGLGAPLEEAPCVIYEKAGFALLADGHARLTVLSDFGPWPGYDRADEPLGLVHEHIARALEKQERKAREWYRTFAWIRASYNALQRVLFEYDLYGEAPEMSLEEATEMVKKETARGGRPRQIDREKVREAIVELLSQQKSCWHRKGIHRGQPNASAIHSKLLRHQDGVLLKEDGDPVTKKWVRGTIREISDDELEELREKVGIGSDR